MGTMLNLVSLAVGLVALLMALPAFLPFLGWGNWFVVPVAVVGLIFGLVSRHRSGQTLNLVVLVLAVGRLLLGGGFF